MKKVVASLNAEGIRARVLRVSGAFHTPLVTKANELLIEAIMKTPIHKPQIPVYSNVTAKPYEQDQTIIKNQLGKHALSKVEFVQQIEQMYADGAKVFLELGPKSVLTKLTKQILEGKEHLAVSMDGHGGGLKGFLHSLGTLITNGVELNLMALFAGRNVQALNLSKLLETQKPSIAKTAWLLNGGSIRPQNEAVGYMGKIPPLNQETVALTRQMKSGRMVNNTHSAVKNDLPTPSSSTANIPPQKTPVSAPLTNRSSNAYKNGSRNGQQNSGKSSPVPVKTTHQPNYSPATSQPQKSVPGITPANPSKVRQTMAYNNQLSGQEALLGYQAYQETMRQFLKLEEQVMKQFFSGQGVGQKIVQPPSSPQTPPPVSSQSVPTIVRPPQPQPQPINYQPSVNNQPIEQPRVQPVGQKPQPVTSSPKVPTMVTSVSQVKPQVIKEVGPKFDREHLTQTLVELVSDRTGYPGEMLGLDQDLEAELGIDSIKRVEILGALAKMLPSDLAQVLNQQMESLTRVKSLNGLVDKLLSTQTSGPSELSLGKSNGETLLEVERSVSPTVTAIPRYVMQPVTEVLPQGKITKLEGLFLITEDQLSCCHHLALLLEQRGAKTAIIKEEILGYPQKLALEVKELQQKLGSVAGIVHLAGLAPLNLPQSLGQWRQYTASEAKSLFYLLSLCQDDLQKAASEKGAYVLSASLFGGYFGRQNISNIGLATAGAGVGLLKTLITEWEQINAKAIDCDPNLSPEMISEQILSELLNPGRLEVGYPQGQRTIFQTVLAPLHPTQSLTQVPQADWVVLVTGGAMGITAEIVNDLAGIGLTLILIGRSPYPEAESPTTQGVEDVATLRKLLLQQELAQGSKPTPVQIEAKIQKLQRQRQLRQNVERFQQAGAKVEYHSVDVRNESEFGAVIEGIYQGYSRLDAVIHGAGIIEDKLIIDKTPESLDRVFDTKVDSAFILTQHLRPEQLKLLVFFTSVAGRYGNRGQSDYAAANEVVTRLAWQLQSQWRNTHVVAINWGPWDTAGMASEGVKRQFRERGIIPIPLEGGCHFFEQEIASGDSKTTEVIAGEGPWEAYEAAQTHHNPIEASDSVVSVKYPLLLQQPELQPNGSVTLEHTFTLASDRYLKDHCLDQKPVLPAAGALEWMAELVEQAWPDWVVTEVRDLRVMRGLVLEGNDGKLVLFKARASTHADSSSLMVTVEIVDPDKKLPYYRAAVVLQPEITNSPPLEAISVISGQSLHPQQAYEDYLFHGQYFQLITAIDHLNEQGIDAQVIPSRPSEWLQRLETASSQWLFDPGLIDTAPQLAIVWARVQGDTTALPSCFGSVKRYDGSQTPQPLKIAFRVNQFDGNSLNYDAIFFDNNRKVHFHLQDISGTCNATLNRLAKS